MEKILIIDDEPGILELCRKVLSREKYNVFTTKSGAEGLKLLPQEMFDLVLTDLRLGDMNGIDLIKKVKHSYPNTEIMVITGQATLETAIEALKSGAYDYIPKPFNIQELVTAVRKALDFSRLRRQENIFREIIYLYKFSQEIPKSPSESDLANFTLERAVKVLQADSGSIFVFQPIDNKLVPIAISGSKIYDNVSLGEGIVGWVAEKKQSLLLQDGLDSAPQFKDLPKRHDIVSSMIVPLMDRDVLLGVICVNRFAKLTNYQFSPHDLESLQIFALHATLILSALRHHHALLELDKLKSEFIANVSHELRTPLMAIGGAMELLKSYIENVANKKINDITDLITRNAQRMNFLVNDLLDFSRLETKQSKLNIVNFSISKLIDETAEDINFKAKEKGISLTIENIDKTPELNLTADREKIKQIISNLLTNAVKFTPNNGWIKLEYKIEGDNSVLVTVADSGIGIPLDKQKYIFDKFYQVDGSISRSHSGFGLGLAIVKSSVLAHKGKIWVESVPNQGAKFFVQLPLNVSEAVKV
jgi:signal transduction histidine kinase/DNA-binding response OmpR family regulator